MAGWFERAATVSTEAIKRRERMNLVYFLNITKNSQEHRTQLVHSVWLRIKVLASMPLNIATKDQKPSLAALQGKRKDMSWETNPTSADTAFLAVAHSRCYSDSIAAVGPTILLGDPRTRRGNSSRERGGVCAISDRRCHSVWCIRLGSTAFGEEGKRGVVGLGNIPNGVGELVGNFIRKVVIQNSKHCS